jgi:hypothetical protein
LAFEGTPLHPRDPLAEGFRGIGQDPRLDHGIDGRVNLASLEGSILGVPRGLQLRRGIKADGRRGDQYQSRNALRRDRGHAQRYTSPERIADEKRLLETQRIHCVQHSEVCGVSTELCFAKAGEIHRNGSVATRGEVRKQLGPHRAIRNASVQQDYGGPTRAALVVWQRHGVDDCAERCRFGGDRLKDSDVYGLPNPSLARNSRGTEWPQRVGVAVPTRLN